MSVGYANIGAHEQVGLRYSEFCRSLNEIEAIYQRVVPPRQQQNKYPLPIQGVSYLRVHLNHILPKTFDLLTRSGDIHTCCKDSDPDNRITIPTTVIDCIITNAKEVNPSLRWGLHTARNSCKVPAKWIVCWLNSVYIDQTKIGWETFECSHRCIESNLTVGQHCIDANCLVWESKASNQSRGHMANICFKACSHCGIRLCLCQSLHDPSCL